MGTKFSWPAKLLVSNFWAGDSEPKVLGVRPGPRKRGFLPNLSPPGVLGIGVVSHLFGIGTTRRTKCWERNFGPRPEKTGPEGGAGQGGNQNFGISIFFIKRTPAKIGRRSLLVLCNFLIRCSEGMHFSISKNARLLNSLTTKSLILQFVLFDLSFTSEVSERSFLK